MTLALVGGKHHDVITYCRFYQGLKNVIEIDNPTGSLEGRINNLLWAIRQHNPDLVVGVNIPDCYEAVNRLRGEKRSTPHVAMAIHGIQPDLLDDMADYGSILDGVICTNRLTMCLAQEDAGLDVSRIFYAPYGVDPGQAGSDKDTRGVKLKIAWVGRLEQFQKRIWDLPRIIRELENRGLEFELFIAGGGSEEVALRGALEREKLTRFTRFFGVVPPEEMQSRVYDACDALLVTSYWETGPIIIWEAMASGVPVVSSRYIGSGLEAGLVDGENCLMFDIGDNEAAATQLQRLQQPELYQRLVAGSHELVNKRYSKKVSIQGWDTAFNDILKVAVRSAFSPRVTEPAGRLDGVLGMRIGESLRRSLGISHEHATTGGEWPHSYGSRMIDDGDFWSMARSLDVRGAE